MTTAKCPKCDDVDLVRSRSKAPPVWECPSCRGMWLMPGEAELLPAALAMTSSEPARAPADKRGGICPFGHGKLDRARVDVEDGGGLFYLDRCRACSGVFFDDGEWARLARSRLMRHIDELWDPLFQKKLDDERADKRWRGELVDELGGDVVDTLDALAERLAQGARLSEAVAWLSARVEQLRRPSLSPAPGAVRTERQVDAVLLHWVRADVALDEYVPESLASVGFVHLCGRAQANEVRTRHFPAGVDLIALVLDVAMLLSPIKEEETGHGVYPHLYGPLRMDAIVARAYVPGHAPPDEVLRLIDDAIDVTT